MKFQIKLNCIYCLSEGSAAQYTNKKDFIGLCFYKDSGITAEWHLCATSHGKRVYDGVAGIDKWQDACASLQGPYNLQIITALQLHNWRISDIKIHNISAV